MPNVLLVDDNVTFARFLRVILESKLLGIHVKTVDSAAAARECLASWTPDLALLDVRLPDGNGHALSEEMAEKCPNLRILMMSAEPLSASSVRGRENIVGVLVKPFATEELLRLVRRALPLESETDRRLGPTPTAPSSSTPAPAHLKQQLARLLSGLYEIRQSLCHGSIDEREVLRVVEHTLVPLIDVVSDMSRDLTGPGGSKP